MVPYKHGKANRGHSCVKGRFAWGYANHAERILNPMIRETHRRALARGQLGGGDAFAARRASRASRSGMAASRSGITSSRCTNEETFLVQKLTRAVFGNNNTDTCARVCHSPTGYGLARPSAPPPARRISTA
jgi:formate dehydrogenase major subunit